MSKWVRVIEVPELVGKAVAAAVAAVVVVGEVVVVAEVEVMEAAEAEDEGVAAME
jgi:hypothetical protein